VNKQDALYILDLKNSSDKAILKRAFRKKALEYHPDKNNDNNSHEKFVSIVEAYEYLSNEGVNTTKKKFSGPKFRSNFSKEEQYEYAKRKFEETESKIYEYEYRTYRNGYKRKLSIVSAILGLLLSIILVADHFLPHKHTTHKLTEIHFEKNIDPYSKELFFEIENQTFHISVENYIILQKLKPELYITQTNIFSEIISLEAKTNNHNSIIIYDSTSINNTFPLIVILLLIPLASLFYEKANFYFLLFNVYYNIYVVPVIIVIILFHDNRIWRLVG